MSVTTQIETKTERITPDTAKKWIDKNVNYRKLKMRTVTRYARSMRDGNWKLNGETIKFDKDGNLIDGQHRLAACVMSGVTIKSLVVYGATHEGVDEGALRSVSDELRFRGYKNYAVLGSAAVFVYQYENGKLGRKSKDFGNDAVVSTVERHPKLVDFVEAARASTALVSESQVAATLYLGTKGNLDNPLAVKFLHGLKTGANLRQGDPVLVLRDFFAWMKMQQHRASVNTTKAHIILAWNALVEGRMIKRKDLSWYETGPKKQEFPSLLVTK